MIEQQYNLSEAELISLLERQLSNFFPISEIEKKHLMDLFPKVLERLFQCIEEVDNKYFWKDGVPFFSPYHSGQYCIYLYLYSNSCSMDGFKVLADKLYYLNKIMHACDIYHEVQLPRSFFLEHPVGTVLGRAQYGNNFVALQGCTVGETRINILF